MTRHFSRRDFLRTACADCRAALDSIPVAEVVRQIEEALAVGGAID